MQSQSTAKPPNVVELQWRIVSLESDVRRMKQDILQMKFDRAIAIAQQGVAANCRYAVASWPGTESELKVYINDSAKFLGTPDVTKIRGAEGLALQLNILCQSNLVFNPK